MIDSLLAQRLIPDVAIRYGIRNLLKQRIKDDIAKDENEIKTMTDKFLEKSKTYPIAVNTVDANEQHYEVPTDFYQYVLGAYKKYSCGHWDKATNLDEAEKEMLEITMQRAELTDGIDILELGCGWGSLTLSMAAKFPNARITAVSNSNTQREHILSVCQERGYNNVNIITCDINEFDIDKQFDRIVSVEMFEHMRNYEKLLGKVRSFLKDDGKLFVHIFVHKTTPYHFDVKDDSDWMSKYFFTGGTMPSDKLFYHYDNLFKVVKHYKVNGVHYSKTAEAWLDKADENKKEIMDLFKRHYGKDAKKWYEYWRIFFMACSELWKFDNGNEWFVSHYLMEKA
jgi:cyclopropane-fatty-acyl-phospholipid synthase